MEKEYNKIIYNRVQRLINIKIAKAFRTTSNDALCILTGLTPVVIKVDAANLQNIMRNRQAHEIGYEVSRKTGFTQQTRLVTEQVEHNIQIFTDCSNSEYGVGAGIPIFIQSKLAQHSRYELHNRCSNNQAELAIVKGLETIGTLL